MEYQDSHLSDQQLLLSIDGELAKADEASVQSHLDACWTCRARHQELESAINVFTRSHQQTFDSKLPPVAGPRALLKARLAQLSSTKPERKPNWFKPQRGYAWAAALCGLLVAGLLLPRLGVGRQSHRHSSIAVVYVPNSTLTPGAALLLNKRAVCAQVKMNNKIVPVALQRKVFEEYGIAGTDPKAYEVDYLVTPALGGADDIHNLWPHSYSATVWNAHVKDSLEERLRNLVCDGNLELTEAQQEIAANWIAAYKKYFHTDKPF
jgi:hypothetical protein